MKTKLITIKPKTHDEWIKQRQLGIGSSEVGTIMGVNPYESPYQLWLRKTSREPAKEQPFAMTAGHYLEDAVSRFWADETGHTIIKSSAGDWLCFREDAPHMRVSPDRIYFIGKRRTLKSQGILECKTTQMTIDPDNIPLYWFCQLQYQMGVYGVNHGAIAWLTAGREFGCKTFAFNQPFYDQIRCKVTEFWLNNIQQDIAPEPTSPKDILLMYDKHTSGKSTEADGDVFQDVVNIRYLKEQKKRIETELEEAENKIKMMMLDSETLQCHGITLATWRTSKDSSKIDVEKLKTEYPDIYDKCLITVPGKRIFRLY